MASSLNRIAVCELKGEEEEEEEEEGELMVLSSRSHNL